MIVDTSVVITILKQEPDAKAFATIISNSTNGAWSAASYLEATVATVRQLGPRGIGLLRELLDELLLEMVPFTPEQAIVAEEAFLRFGKGLHPARLNFGDCFSYALAKSRREPLLFKGSDFSLTDIEPAA